ncbi:MAG TPA: phosphate regulon sensor histidine kinase PhoR [Pseudomonadales bacterium]
MIPGLARELLRTTMLLVAVLLVGFVTHVWGVTILVGLIVWIYPHAREFARFEQWSRHPMRRPDHTAELWQEPAVRVFRVMRHARSRLRRLVTRLRYVRAATEALPDGAILIKRSGEIEMFNAAAQSLLGLSSGDTGKNLVGLVRNPEIAALVNGDVAEGLVEITSTHSQLQLEVRRINIDESRRLILARDVTQLNRLLSMRQDFVANVSHELRTPLTVILGYLESMDDATLDRDQLHELMGRLRPPTKRMKVLVDDLLLLTRLESSPKPSQTELDMVNVAAVLEGIVADTRQLSAGQHRITLEADPTLRLRGSEFELHSAFSNLINNAVRYSPDGGDIHVRWCRSPNGPHFEVEDHGMGIPAHHLSRITERFYRVDLSGSRARGGTGLGLAIVKHVLKRHDATLGVRSELNKGSLFFCDFNDAALAETKE